MTILRIKSKSVYCLVCKKFRTVPLLDTECPRCHAKFKCEPVDYLIIKKKIRTS
jgi:Zn finger protein HypA/HybF involved in hydrogenase expression